MTTRRQSGRRESNLPRPRARPRRSNAPKERPFVRSSSPRVGQHEVEFRPGRTMKTSGGRRLYWHIFHAGIHAGHVSVQFSEVNGRVADASIDVQLNQRSRGRGIGTIAFRRACEMSGLKEVVASIRKGNVASRIAAERAGFVPLENQPTGELLLVWRDE